MIRVVFALLLTLFGALPAWAVKPEPLIIGIFPYLSTRTLVSTYQPLRLYLQRELDRPVEVATAPDLRQFYRRTVRGDYHLIVTPPHFARLHERESGLVPLFSYSNPTVGLLIARRDGGIKDVEQLRGHEIAIAEPSALVAIMSTTWLRSRGLEPSRDYQLRIAGSHNSALMSVVSRETAAAVLGRSAFKQVSSKFEHEIVVLATVGEVMGLVVLAKRDLGDRLPELARTLRDFPLSVEGQTFVERNGIGGFKQIEPAEFEKLDRYLPATLHWLNEE